jgi:peptide/nickel transport system permease protein
VLGYVSPSEDLLACLKSLLLPAIALSSHFVAEAGRQTRAAVREASVLPHIRTGQAKGLGPHLIIFRYVLRTASPPIIAILGLQVGRLFAGTVIIESMFMIPGLGRLVIEAIFARDFPVIQGGVLLIALIVVLGNLIADLVTSALDPRQRYL